MSEKLIQCEECGTEHPVDECGSGTPPPPAAETLEEIAESIARRGLPFSAFRNEQEWKVTKVWLTNEVLSALRNERERCAKVLDKEIALLRSLRRPTSYAKWKREELERLAEAIRGGEL